MILLFNMGVPMIIPAMLFMALALIPIILIESFYTAKRLGIRFGRTVGSVTLGNVLTTLVGIPVTWFLLFIVQVATGFTRGIESFGGKLMSVTCRLLGCRRFQRRKFTGSFTSALCFS